MTPVTPFQGDLYQFAAGDAAAQMLCEIQGYLDSGDVVIEQLQ